MIFPVRLCGLYGSLRLYRLCAFPFLERILDVHRAAIVRWRINTRNLTIAALIGVPAKLQSSGGRLPRWVFLRNVHKVLKGIKVWFVF
jgi:hypothetical protein